MAQEYNCLAMCEAEWVAECLKVLKMKYGRYDPYFIAQEKPRGWNFTVHAYRIDTHYEIKIDIHRPHDSTITVLCKDTAKGKESDA